MSKTKLPWRTQFDKGEYTFATPTGEKTELRHEAEYKKDGRRVLNNTRNVPIYDLIQAHREECEIENIVRRAVEGDYTAVNATQGIFADITDCPSSIAEAQKFIMNQQEAFKKLDKETRAKFEFDANQYIAEMSNDPEGWLDKMGIKAQWEKATEEQKANMLTNENFAKAMANLAQGTTIEGGLNDE